MASESGGELQHLALLTFFSLVTIQLLVCIGGVTGDVIVQDSTNCGSYRAPFERKVYDNLDEVVTSHAGSSYSTLKSCVSVILGRANYQWEVTLEFLQVDKNAVIGADGITPDRCNDYVKVYDGARADSARLLTPITGLCGHEGELPRTRIFTTCQPYVTFEFVTDAVQDNYRGFRFSIYQHPWRNPGTLYPSSGLISGAIQSCVLAEFDSNWDKQERNVGDSPSDEIVPIEYEYSQWCYECWTCPVEHFEESVYGSAAKGGCYMCGKEYDIEFGDARRMCYTKVEYATLLETLHGYTISNWSTVAYVGCREFVNSYNRPIEYCFCDTDYCNAATYIRINKFLLFFTILLMIMH